MIENLEKFGTCRDSAGDSRLDGGRTLLRVASLASLPTIKSRSLKRKADWNFVVNVEQWMPLLNTLFISIHQT